MALSRIIPKGAIVADCAWSHADVRPITEEALSHCKLIPMLANLAGVIWAGKGQVPKQVPQDSKGLPGGRPVLKPTGLGVTWSGNQPRSVSRLAKPALLPLAWGRVSEGHSVQLRLTSVTKDNLKPRIEGGCWACVSLTKCTKYSAEWSSALTLYHFG